MNARLRLRIVVPALAALLPTAGEAATQYQPGALRLVPEPTTASGDITSAEICPAGEYVVGLTGRTGARIDRIGIRCARLLATGLLGAPHLNEGSGLGGGGGGKDTKQCSTGVLASLAFVATPDNRMIENATGRCVLPASGAASGGAFFFGGMGSGGPQYFQKCGPGMGATGLSVRFGKDVNAIGLICDQLVIPKATEAPPVQAATPTKQKPVVITGRTKKTTQSAPPPAARKPGLEVTNGNSGGNAGEEGLGAGKGFRAESGGASAATDTTIYDQPEGNDVAYLSAGDPVTIVKCNGNNWCRISRPRKGWVWGNDLE